MYHVILTWLIANAIGTAGIVTLQYCEERRIKAWPREGQKRPYKLSRQFRVLRLHRMAMNARKSAQ